jgi:creatinine amidohydrolase
MIWDQLTSPDIGALDRHIPVILPIAATEQHGPHLPVATDRMIGQHFAHGVHQADPNRVLVLPPAAVGCSEHHMDFAGTLTLSHGCFNHQVQEILKSVIHHGFHHLILLNSHGGNQGIGQVIIEELGFRNPGVELVLISWWRLANKALLEINESGPGGVGHAGEFETSLMMLIAPDLVKLDSIEKGRNQQGFSWAQGDLLRGSQAAHYQTMKQLTPNGIYGDPRSATVEKGKQITEAVVAELLAVVNDLSKQS